MRQPFPSPSAFIDALKSELSEFDAIQWVESTDSTNTDLLAYLKASRATSAPNGAYRSQTLLLGCHSQHAGKGRAGRSWISKPGECLMFSCAFELRRPIAELAGLSPAIGVATCEALRALLSEQISSCDTGQKEHKRLGLGLKWPNDIQWGQAKLAGILIESAGSRPAADGANDIVDLVIGMGLNLKNGAELSVRLGRPVADWTEIVGSPYDPRALVSQLARAWLVAIKTYSLGGFGPFQPRFKAVDALVGQRVNSCDQGRVLLTGVAQGVNEQGHLLVQTATGVVPVFFGDVSIKLHTPQG